VAAAAAVVVVVVAAARIGGWMLPLRTACRRHGATHRRLFCGAHRAQKRTRDV
jgi:hypothetical protein